MDFTLSDLQLAWQSNAEALGRSLLPDSSASQVVSEAARAGLTGPGKNLLAAAVAVEALAFESPGAAIALALHFSVAAGLDGDGRWAEVGSGNRVGAIALSSDEVPSEEAGRLSGRAAWVAPLTPRGIAVVGMRSGESLLAAVVELGTAEVVEERIDTAALGGIVCGHLRFDKSAYIPGGATMPFMACARILLSAAGVGLGKRALREALTAARGRTGHGAGGEQTVQGLLADTATELDVAMLLARKAAAAPTLSLADASMAKLAATEAAQRAVARATQVVGADAFRRAHIVEHLAQDVRALELFAGRTEALREAVAMEALTRT